MSSFLELQKMKVMEYKNSAAQTEQELKALQDKFNEHKNAQIELQKTFAEANDRLKAFAQSIFVLEGVIKDLEAPAEVPAEAIEDPAPIAEPVADNPVEADWLNTPIEGEPEPAKPKK